MTNDQEIINSEEEEELTAAERALLPGWTEFVDATLSFGKTVLRTLLTLKITQAAEPDDVVSDVQGPKSLDPIVKWMDTISDSVDELVVSATYSPQDEGMVRTQAAAICEKAEQVRGLLVEALTAAGAVALLGQAGVAGAEKCSDAVSSLSNAVEALVSSGKKVEKSPQRGEQTGTTGPAAEPESELDPEPEPELAEPSPQT